MTDSDAPTDRDDADGDAGGSRRTADDGSGETEAAAGTDRTNGGVVPRVVGETNESEADPGDAAITREPEPIEPEALRAENTVFVLLGVFGTIALLATAIVPGVL